MMTKAFGRPCEHAVTLLALLKSFISLGHVNGVFVFSVDQSGNGVSSTGHTKRIRRANSVS